MKIRPFRDFEQGVHSCKANIRKLVRKYRNARWLGDDRAARLIWDQAQERCIDLKAKIEVSKRLDCDSDANKI